ncbi:MAG TPA: GWxTD domain-containing protein [Acidobacteriota bacterium]|nr:GWxTD domain-containing protein [Acidobacteriota bacterium]
MKKYFLFLLMLITAAVFADQYDKWIDETVKVLITKEERDAFKKLKTNEEKEKFITEFWAKRDPSPGTPENEFKAEYENRMKTVIENMKGGSKKAVDTDMGKTVLLLGNPSDSKKEETDPPRQTWTWKGLPKEIGDVEIKFEGDPEAGGYIYSDPKAANQILDKARNYLANLKGTAESQSPAQAKQAVPAATTQQGGPVTTAELKSALDAASTDNPPKDLPVDAIADSFMTSTGEIFATVGLKSSAPQSTKVGVRIVDASGKTITETELPFISAEEKPGYFQTHVPIAPGEYSALIALADAGKAGAVKKPLSVPDYKTALAISSVIFMSEFKQLPDGQGKPEPTAYTFGRTKITPSLDHSFAKTGDLQFLYEIYNAQPDASGEIKIENLEEVVRFERTGANPKQGRPGPPRGFVIGKKITVPTGYPLGTFEPGEYKMLITVTDKTNNATAKREVNFVVK